MNMNIYEYVSSLGSWDVQLKSYNLSLNMWTPEVVQLKSGVTIVAELKFELPKSRFIFYAMVGDIYNFDSWKIDTKNLVFTGNIIKWDNAKHFLSLTRKTPFLCFSFSDYAYMFTYIFV